MSHGMECPKRAARGPCRLPARPTAVLPTRINPVLLLLLSSQPSHAPLPLPLPCPHTLTHSHARLLLEPSATLRRVPACPCALALPAAPPGLTLLLPARPAHPRPSPQDYEGHPHVHANKATAARMPDGSVCLVVAHADPRAPSPSSGSGDVGRSGSGSGQDGPLASLPPALLAGVTWVDTAHHRHGTMGLRWVLAKAHPQPACSVVELRCLAAFIAAGTCTE